MKRLLMLTALLGILTMAESCGCHTNPDTSSINSSISSIAISSIESNQSIDSVDSLDTSGNENNSEMLESNETMSIDLV